MQNIYLHECDEQEEGVGSPPDLLIQEARQKGEDPILGGAAEADDAHFQQTEQGSVVARAGIHAESVLMI